MKAYRLLFVCSVVALPQLAMAETAPQGLGIVRAVVDFCKKVDSRDAGLFEALWTNISHGTTGQFASSSEYKQGYDLVSAQLALVSKSSDAVENCAASVSPSKGNRREDSHKQKRPHS